MKPDGGPIHPCNVLGSRGPIPHEGISLRDHFAGLALSGLLSRPPKAPADIYGADMYASDAYAIADAMIARRHE